MSVTVEYLREELAVDFAKTRDELNQARERLQRKDTPGDRSAVEECRARIDRVLDMYIDMVRGTEGWAAHSVIEATVDEVPIDSWV